MKCGGVTVRHSPRDQFAAAANCGHTAPSFMITLNLYVCQCLCQRMSKRPPVRRHCCVFFCLEPRGRLLKSSLSCATNILAAAVSQQQDVFPERKRGWEQGPNVDLFLLLSFLFWLSRSCRSVCWRIAFSDYFASHFQL